MPNPRQRVPGPTFAPAPFGLLSAAQVIDDQDPHWRNGIAWEPTCSDPARATIGPCDVVDDGVGGEVLGDPQSKRAQRGTDGESQGAAVTLFASHLCSTGGRTSEDDRTRAGTLLTNGEGRALEAVMFTGETEAGFLPPDETILGNAVVSSVLLAPVVSIASAVALAEAAVVSQTGGVGVLYMGHALATLAAGAQVVVRNGARLETVLGTPVVALANENVHDWAPANPGTYEGLWVYGTGPLVVYRQATPQVYDAIDQTVNDRHVIAERTYAFGWDCVTIAVPVSSDVLLPSAPPAA